MQFCCFSKKSTSFADDYPEVFEYPNYNADVNSIESELYGEYSAFRLQNGLDVIFHVHNRKYPYFRASLSVGVGPSGVSRNVPTLNKSIPGLAHLVQNCLFYGNHKYPVPYEYQIFIMQRDDVDSKISVLKDQTDYQIFFYSERHDICHEAISRFAHMFICPVFTTESVQAQYAFIHNEWLRKAHMPSSINERLPQLLMTKGQPAELFRGGVSETLSGNLLEQVELFWRTHYTADNMKLFISVNRGFKDIATKAIFDLFSRIPTYIAESITYPVPPPVPFWSADHADQYLKVYTQNTRRNEMHLYWHIKCEEGYFCHDSLEMICEKIKNAAVSELPNRNLTVTFRCYSYNEFLLEVIFQVQDIELSSLVYLRDKIIEIIRTKVPLSIDFDHFEVSISDFKFSTRCVRMPCSMSEAMMLAPINEATSKDRGGPLYFTKIKVLMEEHLKVLFEQTPRITVSHKSTFLKKMLDNKESSLLFDPYCSIYYQFGNNLEITSRPRIRFPEPSASRIMFKISYPYMPKSLSFLRGVFIEILLIKLKNSKLYYQKEIKNEHMMLKIFVERSEMLEETRKLVWDHFYSPSAPSTEVFEKAKNRWLLEMQNQFSEMSFESIAEDYFSLLIGPFLTNGIDDFCFLVADRNPENATYEDVATAAPILMELGVLGVCFDFFSVLPEYEEKIKALFSRKIPNVTYKSVFVIPEDGETFFYVPPPVSIACGGVMILFDILENYRLLKIILERLLFKRSRNDNQVSFIYKVNCEYGGISIKASGEHTPEVLQNVIYSIVEEIPEFICTMSDSEWDILVSNWGKGTKDDLSEELKMHPLKRYSFWIFQLWNTEQRKEREEYLARLREISPASTKIFESIKDYPWKRENTDTSCP